MMKKSLSYLVAKRYLFSKRTLNVINIISAISVVGLAIGTAALIIILSVFNGFEDLISSLFSTFNPDIKITPTEGKSFVKDSTVFLELTSIPGVEAVSGSIEEIAFFEYRKIQDFGILKGVDADFTRVVSIDSAMVEGSYRVSEDNRPLAILGAGLRHKLSINIFDQFEPLRVYMPKQKSSGFGMSKPYVSKTLQPAGTFYIQQEFDSEYVLTDIYTVQQLMDRKGQLSALEIKAASSAPLLELKQQIEKVVGSGFTVRDRFEQDEEFLRLMRIEKWTAFAILGFTLVLVAFNMIGALWMIVIDKRRDLGMIKAMGATTATVRNIILWEGLMMCLLGLVIGISLAVLFYVVQKTFGVVPIRSGFIIDAYPISMRLGDIAAISLLVLVIGILASLPAAIRAARLPVTLRSA